MKKSRALLFPLLLILSACVRPHTPAATSAFAEDDAFVASTVDIVHIIVETDSSGTITKVDPDPAGARYGQRVQWTALDSDVSIEIFWKSHPGLEKPCNTPARRCGGNFIPVKANTRLTYGVRAYKNGVMTGETDPILEILP